MQDILYSCYYNIFSLNFTLSGDCLISVRVKKMAIDIYYTFNFQDIPINTERTDIFMHLHMETEHRVIIVVEV